MYPQLLCIVVLLAVGLSSCRGAIPLPPAWLFLIENQHAEFDRRDELPFAITQQYENPLPDAPKPVTAPAIVWVDFTEV